MRLFHFASAKVPEKYETEPPTLALIWVNARISRSDDDLSSHECEHVHSGDRTVRASSEDIDTKVKRMHKGDVPVAPPCWAFAAGGGAAADVHPL
jgi:hypothetical protein